jgi:hypothetical protein
MVHRPAAGGVEVMKKALVVVGVLVVLSLIVAGLFPGVRDELAWRVATHGGEKKDYAAYLVSWPTGRHAVEARRIMEDKTWADARRENTIRAYQSYRRDYPVGRFAYEAFAQIERLKGDDRPYRLAEVQGSKTSYEKFLAEFPGHPREADARRALQDMQGRDLVDLLKEKKVEAKTRGAGIERVDLDLRRLVNHEVAVRIPVGTFFVASRASAQNMVTTKESTVVLRNPGWTPVRVPAACANRPRDIPGSGDTFTIERSPQQGELQRLMPVLQRAGVGFDVQQAAVWIVTDNADYADLGILVGGFGGFGPRVIQEREAARAMKLVDEAGVNITRKAIWRDRDTIAKKLTDPALKGWIQQRAARK